MEICTACGMPAPNHIAGCSARPRATAAVEADPRKIKLAEMMQADRDIGLIITSVLSKRGLNSISELDEPTLQELYDTCVDLLEQQPTETQPRWL